MEREGGLTRLDPDTLEVVALVLEQRKGNELYQAAWRAAAKFVRELKLPAVENKKQLNDTAKQITSTLR